MVLLDTEALPVDSDVPDIDNDKRLLIVGEFVRDILAVTETVEERVANTDFVR